MSWVSTVTADSPPAWWRMNATSGTSQPDNVGTNTGTYSGGVTLNQASLLVGDADPSVAFSGGRLIVPSASALNPTTAVSVECLFKPTSLPGASSISGLVVKSGQYGLTLENFGGVQRWAMHVWIAGVDKSNAINTPTPTIGSLVHIIGTYDGANIKLYVNGTLQATVAQTGAISTTANNLTVGDYNSSFPASGQIDEAIIYNTALSSTRVTAHYTAATTLAARNYGMIL